MENDVIAPYRCTLLPYTEYLRLKPQICPLDLDFCWWLIQDDPATRTPTHGAYAFRSAAFGYGHFLHDDHLCVRPVLLLDHPKLSGRHIGDIIVMTDKHRNVWRFDVICDKYALLSTTCDASLFSTNGSVEYKDSYVKTVVDAFAASLILMEGK